MRLLLHPALLRLGLSMPERKWAGLKAALAALLLVPALAPAPPAAAQIVLSRNWDLIEPGETRKVAKSRLTVTAAGAWNRATRRPTGDSETWTRHGLSLDDLSFYGDIKKGEPLFRERHKRRDPLPKFDPAMLPTDLVEWFENSARILTGGALFETGGVRPARLAGYPGVEFNFAYTSASDNLERRGLARAAVIGDRLYMITFDAPKLHYFDAGLDEARAIMDSARMSQN